MVCIYCGSKTKVSNSRGSRKGTWRRRECLKCKAVFTTREQIELESTLNVKHKDGRLEPFSRDKLFLSIHDSLSHRKSTLEDASGLTDTVLSQVHDVQEDGVIEVKKLIKAAQEILDRFDHAGGVSYEAHHAVN